MIKNPLDLKIEYIPLNVYKLFDRGVYSVRQYGVEIFIDASKINKDYKPSYFGKNRLPIVRKYGRDLSDLARALDIFKNEMSHFLLNPAYLLFDFKNMNKNLKKDSQKRPINSREVKKLISSYSFYDNHRFNGA